MVRMDTSMKGDFRWVSITFRLGAFDSRATRHFDGSADRLSPTASEKRADSGVHSIVQYASTGLAQYSVSRNGVLT